MSPNNPITLTYSDAELRILVEEFVVQQKKEFTFRSMCSFILYWAMEEGKTVGNGNNIREGYELQESDQERVSHILESIAKDGRIAIAHGDNNRFEIKAY